MKLTCFSIVAAIALASAVVSSVNAEHPELQAFDNSRLDPTSFFEQFNYDSLSNSGWKVSHARKDDEFSYVGKWELGTPTIYPGFSNDKGLVMKTPAAHHAISYKFSEPFNNTDRDLVLQYEVKLQNGLNCGGTYIKLLDQDFDKYGEFNNETPYQIMFGPDKCGSNNKIHFIIKRKNPISGSMEEKHLASSPMSNTGKISTLYTLILKKNQDFEIRINGEVAKAGNLVKNERLFSPPFNPPEKIIDEEDTKPSDWDDNEYIPNPNAAEKPEDYDLKYGLTEIPDPNATKPENWDESEPEYIEDPSAIKPEDWDDEEDGEWFAPEIRNPKCETVGCGKWKPPLIPNPKYRGPWVHPKIINPNYKGEWRPRLIPNSKPYEDLNPSNIELVGGLGFEIWSMNNDILFDNIYLGHSMKEAELIGNQTFLPKFELENHDLEHNRPKAKNGPEVPPPSFDDLLNDESESTLTQSIQFIKLFLLKRYLEILDFYYEFSSDPINVITEHPFKFIARCVVFVFAFTCVFGVWNVLLFIITGGSGVDKYKRNQSVQQKEEQPPKIEEIKDEVEIEVLIDNGVGTFSSSSTSSATKVTKRKE